MYRGALATLVAVVLIAGSPGCGRKDAAEETSSSDEAPAAASTTAEPTGASAGDPQPTRLSAADLDAYEKGVQAQLDAVQQASEKLKTAKTANDTLSAIGDALPANTQQVAARAAGMELERWKVMAGQVETVLQARAGSAMVSQMAEQMGDTASLSAEARAQLRTNLEQAKGQAAQQEAQAYASLPPDLVETFKARAPHLDSLRLRLAAAQMSLGR